MMPPFEYDPKELFEAIVRLANEKDRSWRFTKKGDKRPAYDIEAAKQSRKNTLARKREVAAARIDAERKARQTRPAPGHDIASRMLRAMEPDKWYGMGDLMRLIGGERHERGKVHQVMVKRGWVEKARNPAYSDRRYSPDEIEAGAEPQPLHLYRLTEVGLKVRDGKPDIDGCRASEPGRGDPGG